MAMLKRCLLVSAILGLALPVAAQALPQDTIVIATGTWTPYVEVGPELSRQSSEPAAGALEGQIEDVHGPLVTITRRAFAAAGVEVAFVSHPWMRNAQLVESGAVDAAMPYYCSEDRAKRFICSAPLAEGEQVFFHRRDMEFDWAVMADLQPFAIGATLGYFYGEAFEVREAVGELKVMRVAKDEVNLNLLIRGRIDLFPQDKAVGYAMIRKLMPESRWHEITHHPKPLHRKSLHLIFTRATPRGARFSTLFERELKKLELSGELRDLLRPLQTFPQEAGAVDQP